MAGAEVIPQCYRATALTPEQIAGWLEWSLEYFSDATVPQRPHLDLTLPLDLTAAWKCQGASDQKVSLFAWLIWSFMQVIRQHDCFLYRKVDGRWWQIDNPPVLVPVAIGGSRRFCGIALEDVAGSDWHAFAARYHQQLAATRA